MVKPISIRCSSIPRLTLCPGSLRAAEGIISSDSVQSTAGTAGHTALEMYYNRRGEVPIEEFIQALDDMTASRARWYAKVMDEIIESHGGAKDIFTEVPMSDMMRISSDVEVELTGHADLIVTCNDGITLVSDWKFNFLEVPEAAQNIQLMGYAYLLAKDPQHQLIVGDKIHTILVAGGNERPFTAAVYTPDTIEKVEKCLSTVIQSAIESVATRIPSEESCKYCPARGTNRCLESIAEVSAVPQLLNAYEVMPGKADCKRLYEVIKTVESFGKKFMADLKKCVIADPEGWADLFELKSTGCTRTIKDAQQAYDVFVDTNELLSAEEFLSIVSVPIGKLEKALKPALSERKIPVKDHKMMIAGLLGENLEAKEKAPSLKVVKS